MANGGRRRPKGILKPYEVYLTTGSGERRIATIAALSEAHALDLARKSGHGKHVRVSPKKGMAQQRSGID